MSAGNCTERVKCGVCDDCKAKALRYVAGQADGRDDLERLAAALGAGGRETARRARELRG